MGIELEPIHQCVLTLSHMNISETIYSGLIAIKFYLKHWWARGKTVSSFGQDRIRSLVSMATDSSHRVIMGVCCQHSSILIFDWIFFILADNEDNHKISYVFEIQELAALECLKKSQ